MIALSVIAALAGLGYKLLMDLRGKNVAAVKQAELDMEAKRRAENPLYALRQDMKNTDGLIDINSFGASYSSNISPEAKARNELTKRPLNADEFLNRIDAKAYNYSPLDMEALKYTRARWALSTCRHTEMYKFYTRQNKTAYELLKGKQDAIRTAKLDAHQAKIGKISDLEIRKIETKTQALAFVASGGVARHQEAALNMMSGLDGMVADMDKHKVSNRCQRFSEKGCMQVRTIIQSGRMTVKPNVRMN